MKRDFYFGVYFYLLIIAVNGGCYFPNGRLVEDTPCNAGAGAACCGIGYACLSNGLCQLTAVRASDAGDDWATFVRGSCTDRSWSSPNCPKECMKASNGDVLGGGNDVAKCEVGGGNRYYCLNNQTSDPSLSRLEICTDPNYFFELDENPTTATVISLQPSEWMTATPTTLSTTSIPASTTSPSTSSETSALPVGESRPDNMVPIGVGVGIPLGLLAIGVVGFLFYRTRTRAKARAQEIQVQEKVAQQERQNDEQYPGKARSHNAVHEVGSHWDETHELPVAYRIR